MTGEQVQQIIDAILNATLLDNWHLYFITLCVSLVSISGLAFLKSYFTEQGKYAALETKLDLIEQKAEAAENAKYTAIQKNLNSIKDQILTQEKAKYEAIEESLDTIKKQVQVTTEASERIKHSLEINNWREKEVETLKRSKLEEYGNLILLIQDNLKNQIDCIREDKNIEYDENILEKSTLIQSIYLPEISAEHQNLMDAALKIRDWIKEDLKLKAQSEHEAWPCEYHDPKMPPLFTAMRDPRISLLQRITAVGQNLNISH